PGRRAWPPDAGTLVDTGSPRRTVGLTVRHGRAGRDVGATGLHDLRCGRRSRSTPDGSAYTRRTDEARPGGDDAGHVTATAGRRDRAGATRVTRRRRRADPGRR